MASSSDKTYTNTMPASTLIIPVESQVRELDAKLLLAAVAAERGFPVVLGSRAFVHFKIASLPRGIYLAKSMRSLSDRMFRIVRRLGHEIVAWDEEALVHPPPETYFTLRLSPGTVREASHLLAWGPENLELLRQFPALPQGIPIHVTGNPRGDMLRPETRHYFDREVAALNERYGDFLLINTNFSDVNPFIPGIGLFQPGKGDGTPARFGQSGKGMSREFAEGLGNHKRSIMADFVDLIPRLHRAYPDRTIVIRPHPSESYDVYHQLAAGTDRVVVDNEGNIIPWLLASAAMIHNGCTTGVEAYLLRVPAVSYLPTLNEYYDYEFQGLPTKLSHQTFSFEELRETLDRVLAGELGAADGAEREALIDHYLAARAGPLASDRIVTMLEGAGYLAEPPKAAPLPSFVSGWLQASLKSGLTQLYMRRPGPNRLAYHDHRFPELSVGEIEDRIARFGSLLNRFQGVTVKPHSRHLFRIKG